jgi:hypothetical protein
VLALLLAGCHPVVAVTGPHGADTAGDPDTDVDCGGIPDDDADYEALFDPSVVHGFAFTVDEDAMGALAADPDGYVVADAVIDGHAFERVGIKWRGDSSQERWDGKPGFKVDLRQFGGCASLGGTKRLTLDGMTDDPAQGRVLVATAAMSAAGLPSPRAAYATVTVNGAAFGLYAHVETVDGSFVERRWDDDHGTLWEGKSGADFSESGVEAWHDVDSDGDRDALRAVAAAVQGSGDGLYAATDALVDLDQALSTWGMQAAIGDDGAFPYDTDDVYLYAPPGGRFAVVPWGLDGGWDPAFAWDHVDTVFGARCVYDAVCGAAVRAHVEAALATVEAIDVGGFADAAFAVSAPELPADPRRGTPVVEVQQARQALGVAIDGWPGHLRDQLE